MLGISKNIKGLIIIGIGLCLILTPIIFTLDNAEQEINDDDFNPNEEKNDEEPKTIIDDDDPVPPDPVPTNDDDPVPPDLEPTNDDDPAPSDPEPTNDDDPAPPDPEPTKDDDPAPPDPEPTKDDDGLTKDDDGPTKDDDGPTKDDDDPNPKDQIITATIDFCPKTLNLKSKGKWVTVYIELPDGYNVNDIDIDSILLDELPRAESSPTEIGYYEEDNIIYLMVKFDRQAVIEFFELEENEEIITGITGKLDDDGTLFQGTCTIGVINP